MIAQIKGIVEETTVDGALIDVNGVGFYILLSGRDLASLPSAGQPVRIYTSMSVREDAITLFGFLAKEDREMFRLLQGVSGIGPKAALGILSTFSARALQLAVLSDDSKTIANAPGIGVKTAKKLILELKDKFSIEDIAGDPGQGTGAAASSDESVMSDAVAALTALGYSASEALSAVRSADVPEGADTETVLKQALKKLI